MKFEIPRPMKIEHDELHADLVNATKAGGETGDAAKAVAKMLHNHFVKEEEYALPPLGLLVALSEGKFETSMADVLKMTDKLEAELPTMLSEHRDIVAALMKLIEAANAEAKPRRRAFRRKADAARPKRGAGCLSDCAIDRPLCEIATCRLTGARCGSVSRVPARSVRQIAATACAGVRDRRGRSA